MSSCCCHKLSIMDSKMDLSGYEQQYMLEIFLRELKINSEKLSTLGNSNLSICIKLIDISPFEIYLDKAMLEKYKHTKEDKENHVSKVKTVPINNGKTFLINRTPKTLETSVKCLPLEIAIVKVNDGNLSSPLCKTKVPLPCCFFDQINDISYGSDGLPVPSTIQTTYLLSDQREKSCGSISTSIRLTNFANSIITDLALERKSLVFENLPDKKQFNYVKVTNDSPLKPMSIRKIEESAVLKSTPRSCTPLAPISGKLPLERYLDLRERPALKCPESSPRISIDQPGFENLTSAEKLNDSRYRDLVYRSYPDEPTCSCLPRCQSMHPMICQAGCTRSCCMSLRNPGVLHERSRSNANISICRAQLPQFSSMCLENCGTNYNGVLRMRGGGEGSGEGLCPKPSRASWVDYSMDYKLYANNLNNVPRLGGGGEVCACTTTPVSPIKTDILNACKPGSKPPQLKMPGCTCVGKEASMARRGAAKCSKKPCMGVDCLLRAFQEAQEFVDSLGKVPGLVGLGLMDPTESPFFGRVQSYEDIRSPAMEGGPVNPQCTALCNPVMMTHTPLGTPIVDINTPVPSPTGLVGRAGIVREAIPSLPDPSRPGYVVPGRPRRRADRKEDEPTAPINIETGPCGEPLCKSRRIIPGDEGQEAIQLKASKKTKGKQSGKGKGKKGKGKGRDDGKDRFGKGRDDYGTSKSRSYAEVSSRSRADIGRSTSRPYDMDTGGKSMQKSDARIKGSSSSPWASGDFSIDLNKCPIKISKQVMRFVYSVGDYYPGVAYGHRDCIDPILPVPANMGWRWNISSIAGKLKPRIGWKPGAIPRVLYEKMVEVRAAFEAEAQKEAQKAIDHKSEHRQGGGGSDPGPTMKSILHKTVGTPRSPREAGDAGAKTLQNPAKTDDKSKSNKPPTYQGKVSRLGGGGGERVEAETQSCNVENVEDSNTNQLENADIVKLGSNGNATGSGGSGVAAAAAAITVTGGNGEIRQQETSKFLRMSGGGSKLKQSPSDIKTKSLPSRAKKGTKSAASNMSLKKDSSKKEEQPPTLHIQRKDGTYYVTMYPIRQEPKDETHLQEPIKPLQFKIVKNKDDDGSTSSSAASDMEIEFSPPAAIQRQRKKPDVIHTTTQVKQQEILDAMGFPKEKKKKKKDTFPCR